MIIIMMIMMIMMMMMMMMMRSSACYDADMCRTASSEFPYSIISHTQLRKWSVGSARSCTF